MMKKAFMLLLVVLLTTASCSTDTKTNEQKFVKAEMEMAYVLPLSTSVEEDYSSRRIHVVSHGENLYDLAEYYLGNARLWGDFLVENQYLAKEAASRGFQRPNGPGWLIYPGEII